MALFDQVASAQNDSVDEGPAAYKQKVDARRLNARRVFCQVTMRKRRSIF